MINPMDLTLTAHLTAHASRCLNGRGSPEFCQQCRDNCPQHAIEINDRGIHFIPSHCNDCAICVADCPTEVFSHDGFAPIDFISSAKEMEPLNLCCQASELDPTEPDTLSIPCHGVLKDYLLVALRTMGVKKINLFGLEKCQDCLTTMGKQRLFQTLEKAPPTLSNHFPSLYDASKDRAITSPSPEEHAADINTSETATDRRRFLDRAANAVAYATLSSLPIKLLQQSAERISILPEQVLPEQMSHEQNRSAIKHLPQSHQLARSNLQGGDVSITDIGNANAWFFEVHEQGSCDACDICALSCPTGALFSEDSEQTLKLIHQPAACIGCGLCISLCPQQALKLSAADDDAVIIDGRSHTLFESEKLSCRSCDTNVMYLTRDTGLCRACDSESAIQKQWLGK